MYVTFQYSRDIFLKANGNMKNGESLIELTFDFSR